MVNRLSNKKISYLFTGIIFLLLNFMGITLLNQAGQIYLTQQRETLFYSAQKQAFKAQNQLEELVLTSSALATMVDEANGDLTTNEFNALAQKLKAKYPHIGSFQLAPQGVVAQVYPFDADLLNNNYLNYIQRQWKDISFPESQQPSLFGPILWGQKDSLVLVGYTPIFVQGKFWGLASTLTWFDDFLTTMGWMWMCI